MPNPYKLPSTNLPPHLATQLRTLPTLSLSTIAALSFPLAHPPELLVLVAQATRDQQDKYHCLFGNEDTAQNSEESAEEAVEEIENGDSSQIGEGL
jgi:hypothetical protein